MLKAYQDKETEFNWETRDKSVTRLRGLLRGNATDSQYLEVLVLGIKQVVDGIVKSVSFTCKPTYKSIKDKGSPC